MRNVLLAAPDIAVVACRYAPGERHPPHTDTLSRISFLVRGGYREDTRAGSVRVAPGEVLLKSRRTRHEDVFGEAGAALVALEFLSDEPFDQSGDPGLWRRCASAFSLRHAITLLEAALGGDSRTAVMAGLDLLANAGEGGTRGAPPAWLTRLKDELEQTPLARIDIAARARAAGVHVSHLSRLFRRCYGASITEYAQAHSVRRALASLAQPQVALSDAALAAGFYDQSHLNRVFRRITGRTPGACRAMLAAC